MKCNNPLKVVRRIVKPSIVIDSGSMLKIAKAIDSQQKKSRNLTSIVPSSPSSSDEALPGESS